MYYFLFTAQTVVDSSESTLGTINPASSFPFNTDTNAVGFVWSFVPKDPACGPGTFTLQDMYIPLSASSPASMSLTFQVWTWNVATSQVDALLGQFSSPVTVGATPGFIHVRFSGVVCDANAANAFMVFWMHDLQGVTLYWVSILFLFT